MKLTGTFLDEITHDIPTQNWGEAEWDRDFAAMKAVGIDTVILIRAGYKRRVTFDSKVLQKEMGAFPAYVDLVDTYLRLAEKYGFAFYFGTYDSGQYWHAGNPQKESDINRAFCDEVVARYGHRKAFKGWYISHEVNAFDETHMRVYENLSKHLRQLKHVPILMSPYVKGRKQFGAEAISLEEHTKSWSHVFDRLKGHVDIVAFQDGQVEYEELADYLAVNRDMAAKRGLTSWGNVECFDRDMPIKFPPIDIRMLRYKIELAARAQLDKLITFEFSHFMSPNSCYPAARNLYDRYKEWAQL